MNRHVSTKIVAIESNGRPLAFEAVIRDSGDYAGRHRLDGDWATHVFWPFGCQMCASLAGLPRDWFKS